MAHKGKCDLLAALSTLVAGLPFFSCSEDAFLQDEETANQQSPSSQLAVTYNRFAATKGTKLCIPNSFRHPPSGPTNCRVQ